jgi:hypothetical protein
LELCGRNPLTGGHLVVLHNNQSCQR